MLIMVKIAKSFDWTTVFDVGYLINAQGLDTPAAAATSPGGNAVFYEIVFQYGMVV